MAQRAITHRATASAPIAQHVERKALKCARLRAHDTCCTYHYRLWGVAASRL